MNFSPYDLLSINELLADILVYVDDEATNKINEKFYYRQIRGVLEDLNFTTLFYKVYQDVKIPKSLQVLLPKNMWNVIDIFCWNPEQVNEETGEANGICTDKDGCCSIGNCQRLFHKYNYLTLGKGMGSTSRNMLGNMRDVFIQPNFNLYLHWYNIQNGIIYLSENCYDDYKRMRIVSNGLMGGDITDLKIISPFVRDAVVLAVSEKICLAIKSKNIEPQRYRQMWMDIKTQLYTPKGRGQGSVWEDAVYRLKKTDTKEFDDLRVYLSKISM